jgi:hypothetical protein
MTKYLRPRLPARGTKAALAAFAVAAALVAPPALAQTAPTKKEMVARVLQLQQPGIEAMARQIAQQPAMQIMQQAGAALQRVPQERRDALARDIEADVRKYVDESVPVVTQAAVRLAPSTIGALLEERFSEEELRQIIGILESPVNRKFQSMAQEMQRSIVERLVADTRGTVEPKVRALQDTVAQRLGVPSGSPAASAPR